MTTTTRTTTRKTARTRTTTPRRATTSTHPHLRLLPPPDPRAPAYQYPGLDAQGVFDAKWAARIDWLEGLGLDPWRGGLRLMTDDDTWRWPARRPEPQHPLLPHLRAEWEQIAKDYDLELPDPNEPYDVSTDE